MKHLVRSLALILAVGLAACGGSGPADTAGEFFHYIDQGSTQEAANMLTGPAVGMLGKEKMGMMLAEGTSDFKKKGGIDAIETISEEVEGETASVQLRLKFKNGESDEEKVNLLRVDDRWMVLAK